MKLLFLCDLNALGLSQGLVSWDATYPSQLHHWLSMYSPQSYWMDRGRSGLCLEDVIDNWFEWVELPKVTHLVVHFEKLQRARPRVDGLKDLLEEWADRSGRCGIERVVCFYRPELAEALRLGPIAEDERFLFNEWQFASARAHRDAADWMIAAFQASVKANEGSRDDQRIVVS